MSEIFSHFFSYLIDPEILVLGFGFVLLFWLILKGRKKDWRYKPPDLSVLEKVPEGRLHIKELAQIWLKYNDRLIENMAKDVVINDSCNTQQTHAEHTTGHTEKYTEKPIVEKENKTVQSAQNIQDKTQIQNVKKESLIEKVIFEKYGTLIEKQKATCLVKHALKLLEENAKVSSVSGEVADPENLELKSYKEALSKITLKEHTLRVVKEALKLLKAEFHDPSPHIPKILVAALYHDLGKIPGMSKVYGERDHATASRQILLATAKKCDKNPFWLEEVAKIVREHHFPSSSDRFTQILRKADCQARAQEVAEVLSDFSHQPFNSWFNPKEFMETLYFYINQDKKTGGKWIAFTHKSIIYITLEGLLKVADEMRLKKKILCPEFLFESERKKLATKIAGKLAEANLTFVKKYPIQKYAIVSRDGRRFNALLVALKTEYYPEEKRHELELRRQATIFSTIVAVKPV